MKSLVALMAGVMLLMATGSAWAGYITLSTAELLTAAVVDTNTKADNKGGFQALDYAPTGALFTQNMSRPLDRGAQPYYVYSYLGVDSGAIGKSDLTGIDSFALSLANVNNSPWELALFLQAGGTTYLGDYQLVPNQKEPIDLKYFSYDLSRLGSDVSNVEYLGFAVRSMLVDNPSNPDAYHVMAAPVPEPGTVLLLGIGCIGLAIYGKRRQNA